MCPSGKLAYVTVQDAYRAMIAIDKATNRSTGAKKAGWHSGEAKPYKCAACHEWHIGHSTPRGAKRKPAPGE